MHLLTATTLTELAYLVLAFILSAVIGIERERKLKSAGLKTHALVGLGSTVFTLVSAYGFSGVVGTTMILDPSRIAAQVVSGIGFLGAGVIFVRRNAVSGLTTAASIWVTAAVGMACGAGMPLIAVAATALHLVAVVALTFIVTKIPTIEEDRIVVVHYDDGMGVLRTVLMRANALGFETSLTHTRQIERTGAGARVEANLRFRGRTPLQELMTELSELDGVRGVRLATIDRND